MSMKLYPFAYAVFKVVSLRSRDEERPSAHSAQQNVHILGTTLSQLLY